MTGHTLDRIDELSANAGKARCRGTEQEADIGSVEESLGKPERKAPPSLPLERREDLLKQDARMHALRRHKAIDNAHHKSDCGP